MADETANTSSKPPAESRRARQRPLYRRFHQQPGIWETTLSWAAVAPTRPAHAADPRDPAYRWPPGLDQDIALAAQHHITVLLSVGTSPAWANKGRATNYAPIDPQDYAAELDKSRLAQLRQPCLQHRR